MLASELIEELERMIEQYGDCVVTFASSDNEVGEVRCYDINGNLDGKVVEFSLAQSN